ncbi:MAG: SUF system Fe-S cluster assembly regulator, partial [Gammaproteobacteria bacterium]|nr:SUF system Fe-S cluster assembly regulator [Gammaproteobacteria bacterium]
PVALTECSSESGNCVQESSCSIRISFQRINNAILRALEEVSVAEMIEPISPPKVDIGELTKQAKIC